MNKNIFISYAWENNSEEDKIVKNFVDWLKFYLESWSFTVYVDRFDNYPGSQLDEFMKQGIDKSHFVICICTKTYIEKMKDSNTGVYNEVNLLIQKASQPFIIPVVDKDNCPELPDFFAGTYHSEFHFKNPNCRENQNPTYELLKTLSDEMLNSSSKNNSERIENYYNNAEKLTLFNKTIEHMQVLPQLEGQVTFQYSLNNGEFKFGYGKCEFLTKWSKRSDTEMYTCNEVNSMSTIPDFKDFSNIYKPEDLRNFSLIPGTWCNTVRVGDGIVWINENNFIAIGKVTDIKADRNNEFNNSITFDYRILNPLDLTDDFENIS